MHIDVNTITRISYPEKNYRLTSLNEIAQIFLRHCYSHDVDLYICNEVYLMHEMEALISVSGEIDGSWDGNEKVMSAGTSFLSFKCARYIF